MPDDETARLSLLGRDVNDLAVVSSMLQDAIVPVADMAYLEKEHAFVMAVNRFRWELPAGESGGERVHSGLRFDTVKRVQFRNVDREDREQFASILSIAYDNGVVVIHFAGTGAIRLEVDELLCALKDFDQSWPTIWRPDHSDA